MRCSDSAIAMCSCVRRSSRPTGAGAGLGGVGLPRRPRRAPPAHDLAPLGERLAGAQADAGSSASAAPCWSGRRPSRRPAPSRGAATASSGRRRCRCAARRRRRGDRRPARGSARPRGRCDDGAPSGRRSAAAMGAAWPRRAPSPACVSIAVEAQGATPGGVDQRRAAGVVDQGVAAGSWATAESRAVMRASVAWAAQRGLAGVGALAVVDQLGGGLAEELGGRRGRRGWAGAARSSGGRRPGPTAGRP